MRAATIDGIAPPAGVHLLEKSQFAGSFNFVGTIGGLHRSAILSNPQAMVKYSTIPRNSHPLPSGHLELSEGNYVVGPTLTARRSLQTERL